MFKHKLIICIFISLFFFQNSYSGNAYQLTKPAPGSATDTNVIIPPAWAFGVLYGGYTNQQQTIQRIDEIQNHDYPIDAYWIDSWFWSFADKGRGPKKFIDFTADTIEFPNRKEMWDYMQKRNIKGGFWTWDCIFETGNEQAFNDFDEKGFFRNKYTETNPWHNNSTTTAMYASGEVERKGTLCGNIDFKNPQAVEYFKQRMKHFFDEGADFLKLDRTNAIEVCKTMYEITKESGRETKGRGFILSHAGGMDSEEYKRYPAKWTSDTRTDWTVEKPNLEFDSWVPRVALKENIAMFTNPNQKFSKIPFMTNDLGGFDMGKTKKPDEELFIRWMEFSMFASIVEVFSQPENPTSNLAYKISARADSLFRKYSHLRMELFPYIYSYAHRVRLEGKQMMQALPVNHFDYMFGNEMLVAPVYEQFVTKRFVNFPAGNWINFWTKESIKGGEKTGIEAPIDQLPLFIRQGSIIPMRQYASSIGKGTNDTLIIHIYPGANSEFTLVEDDGLSNEYLNGAIAQTKMILKNGNKKIELEIQPVNGCFNGMTTCRVIKFVIYMQGNIKSININKNTMKFYKSDKITETEFVVNSKLEKTTLSINL